MATLYLAEEIDGLQLEGSADLPARTIFAGREIPPRRLKYDEIANKGSGWKLHLDFDPDNVQKVQHIRHFLDLLKLNNAITTFKIGDGGGKKHDAPGKEATVYIGHRDKAQVIARAIEGAIGDLLDVPDEDAMITDVAMPETEKIIGRFEVTAVDPDFAQYGAAGFPLLKVHMRQLMVARLELSEKDFASLVEKYEEASEAELIRRYGVFYTGNED